MNTYIIKYESNANNWRGICVVDVADCVGAQNIFFAWLQKQPVYNHLTDLKVGFGKIDKITIDK